MKTLEASTIDPAVMVEISHAIDNAVKGVRDPELMRLAAERMDKTRAEIFQRVGLVDFAVPTIRELRDE